MSQLLQSLQSCGLPRLCCDAHASLCPWIPVAAPSTLCTDLLSASDDVWPVFATVGRSSSCRRLPLHELS